MWKPSKKEIKLIKEAARKEAGMRRVILEVGERYNLHEYPDETNINIAMVSDDHEDFGDTDLVETWDFDKFEAGVELTEHGVAIVDFYIYSPGDYGSLESNVTVFYSEGKIQKIVGVKCDSYEVE